VEGFAQAKARRDATQRRHAVNDLLSKVLDAHGGLARWNSLDRVEATIVTDGTLWGMKGLRQHHGPRQVIVWPHHQRSKLGPSSDSDLHSDFTPDRIAILNCDGDVIAERSNPRDSFAGHVNATWWDPLQLAYFEGYALWTHLSAPFLLAEEGVEVAELHPWTEAGETWRVLRAHFPAAIVTHSIVQEWFFGEDLLLRRHDYRIDVAGGFDAVDLVYRYVEMDRLCLPTRHRSYTRGPERLVNPDPLMVSIDISNVGFT
jgi:hypothetical protein